MDHDQLAAVTQSYGSAPDPTVFATAEQMLSDPQPHIRQQAVTVLTALGQEGHSAGRSNPGHVDAIFQRLCVVAATDTMTRLRLQALQALASKLQWCELKRVNMAPVSHTRDHGLAHAQPA